MASAMANRESGTRPQRVGPATLRPALRAAADGAVVPEVVPLSSEIQPRHVLRALVETFGGEVTSSTLTRHLSHQMGRTMPSSGLGLTDLLNALHTSGALSLEANGQNDFIVRLLPAGAELYV